MTFTKGESTKYQTYTLDTLPGEPRVGNYTTTTSTLIQVDQPVVGKSAQIELNVDSTGATVDSGYYSQDAASNDLYAMGFGVTQFFQVANMLGAGFGFQAPEPGWILLVKMGSPKGTSWSAYEYTTSKSITLPNFPLPVMINIHVSDSASMLADTTFDLSGKTYGLKHAKHVFSVIASTALAGNLASFSKVIDSYVSGDLGATVITVQHPTEPPTISALLKSLLTTGVPGNKTRGSILICVSHQ